ncbi:MAG TPA: S26 family signal peptidase, partial [Solirubrobacteraceae bacterium]
MLRLRVRSLGQGASLPAALALALAGCGASQGPAPASPAALVQATASAYYAALARQDAAAACAQITPAYWEATLSEARAALPAARGQRIPRGTCGHVLRYVFSLNPTSGSRLAKMRVTVRDVSFHGAGAFAIVSDGRSAGELRFVRSVGGHWLIDCCTRSEARKLKHSFYRVPSVSMEPTLKPGQLVAADTAALRTRPPSLGEIVTLHAPTDPRCASAGQGEGFPQPCGKPP